MEPLYKNMKVSVEERVNDLLSRMTLMEKVGQMNQTFRGAKAYHMEEGKIVLKPEFEQALKEGMAGAVYGMHRTNRIENGQKRTITPQEGVRAINYIQKIAIESSRHGIPLLVSEECPKGYLAAGATVFPSPILYGSSWNRALLEKMGRIIATETRAGGGNCGYGPILDISHDPRWSRIEEIFGEDPYLAGELGAAMVKGFQGNDLKRNDTVVSTLKHFAAYGNTEGGRNTAPAHLGERELREMHLASFEAAIKAGAQSVMCSYTEIDGVPVSANHWLLTEILRGEWGFEGFVVGDALAIDELSIGNAENIKHRVAPTLEDAAALAATAGVDISLWDEAYMHLFQAVKNGKADEKVIDRAVARILRIKFLLGLFENPYTDEQRALVVIGSDEHRECALDAARQSITLLKNEQSTLPLKKDKRIAVIGPNAHNLANMLGTYAPQVKDVKGTTVFEGIRTLATDPKVVNYALGCRVKDPSKDGFAEAIEIANSSDYIVAVVGGSSTQDGAVGLNAAGQTDLGSVRAINDIDNGEGVDRADLELAGVQMELLNELKALGKPLVVVLIQGRPYEMSWIAEHADAIVCAWYPGQDGGKAVGEILFGKYNPSGKLTISFPKSVGQIPVNYNHKPTAEKKYLFCDTKPLYSFGFGLSYTTYQYGNLKVSLNEHAGGRSIEVSVDVTNKGERLGEEIVQLYIRDEYATVTRPIKMLRNFTRVHLNPGETKTATFTITAADLSCWNIHMQYIAEPGEYTVMVGGNSEETLQETFVW